ncbi:hypothetical protein IT575_03035 [bacterium]|nr:hypothetical protein [bacterium]
MTLSPYVYQRVSNPIALDIIEALHRMLQRLDDTRRGLDDSDPAGLETLKERLRRSGLAQGLAGGPGLLPERRIRRDWLFENFERLHRPRSYPALAREMALHLEWYLRPWEPEYLPRNYARLLAVLLGGIGVAVTLGMGFYSGVYQAGTPGLLIIGGLLLPGILLLLSSLSTTPGRPDDATLRRNVQALMEYLIESYSDDYTEDDERGPVDKYGLGWG